MKRVVNNQAMCQLNTKKITMREKVKLDPEKVNTMRLSMTDLEIRKEL